MRSAAVARVSGRPPRRRGLRRSVPRRDRVVDAVRRGLFRWRSSLSLPVAFCGLTLAVAGAGVLWSPQHGDGQPTTAPPPEPSLLAGMFDGAHAGAASLDRSLS